MNGPVTIYWKKYKPQLPALVYRSEFDYYKSQKVFPVNSKLKYLEEFWAELFLIVLAFLGGLCETYHWYPMDGAFGLVVKGITIVAFFGLIGLIISTMNFVKYNAETNRLTKHLRQALSNSNTYEAFCSEMSQIDNRYILQYEELRND